MSGLVRSETEFSSIEAEMNARIYREASFPEMVFRGNLAKFVFIDFDNLFDEAFYFSVAPVAKNDGILCFVCIEPDPRGYFYHYFGSFGAVTAGPGESYETFMKALKEDPGESPADALIHNSSRVVAWNWSLPWTIYGERSLGIAVLGFKSLRARDKFESAIQVPVFTADGAVEQLIPTSFPGGAVPDVYRHGIVENYGNG